MIKLEKKLADFKQSDFDLISVYLHAGKVLILPTDTIYGLSCLATDSEAIEKIFRLKKREPHKPLITLVSSLAMVKRYAYLSKSESEILNKLWSQDVAPTTVILRAKTKNNLPREIISDSGGISCRLPKSDFLIKIIKRANVPIISTSLNLSGHSPLIAVGELDYVFSGKNKPDLIVNIGQAKKKKPSRLVDLRGGDLKIIRK
ncbi:MAG TPA: L-threonylcarbamoyladenylate synthase [Candidatus Saccharimonadales bacterium]|nr:L-threonylcarbamoyladenylate synthase [Candidatus Saccharimonadales bacterium]